MVIIIHCERRNLDYGIPGRTGIQSIPLRDEVSAPKGVCKIGRNKSSRLIEWASAWIFVGWLVCVFPDKEMEDDNVGDIKLGCCCASSSHLAMYTHKTAAGEKEEHGNLSSRQITSQPGADDFFYWMSLLCCCIEEGYGIFVVVVTTRSMFRFFRSSQHHPQHPC